MFKFHISYKSNDEEHKGGKTNNNFISYEIDNMVKGKDTGYKPYCKKWK